MAENQETGQLFEQDPLGDKNTVFINSRCRLHMRHGFRVVSVSGLTLAHYSIGDRMGEAYAMVSLVEQGWAQQKEVARAFDFSARTIRRNQRRYEEGGLAALGRPPGYPRGRPRLTDWRITKVQQWMAEGIYQREIARRLGITEKAVRKLVKRLGWKNKEIKQLELPLEGADPNLSAFKGPPADEMTERPTMAIPGPEPVADVGADPNLSAISEPPHSSWSFSMDADPTDRSMDRLLACMGLLDDATPWFRQGKAIKGAGVLLAVPALVQSGVFEIAREVYGSIGPAFYGLRTTLVTFLLMALLRVKRPEGMKEHSPEQLGRLLGLDRAPEVKTLRRKLARLSAFGRAKDFGRALANHRFKTRGPALGFLYIDGHVRVYHGKRTLPKTHVARMRLPMPATTDYWVNDSRGEPLFVVNTEANKNMVKMLPDVLDEVRQFIGDRRVTVVFDRGGWSPRLFKRLIASGFDILTYRKGRSRKVSRSRFALHEATLAGQAVSYWLADQNILLNKRKLKLRQVTRLCKNGHQTPIVTSRWDLPAVEVAFRMFERWRQENFFKYLREEYALDALVDYGTEPADPERDVPNPMRKKLNAELKKAFVQLIRLQAEYGFEAFVNPEELRRTMRGFKIANAALGQQLLDAMQMVVDMEKKRASVPSRVPVKAVTKGEVVKLRVERKLLSDLFKMVAYQAESELVRLICPHYRRADDEGRTLIQNALAGSGDIEVTDKELIVYLEPLSSPHRTQVLVALCEDLSQTKTKFPGTELRLSFEVLPPPDTSMAFPGPRPDLDTQPDIL